MVSTSRTFRYVHDAIPTCHAAHPCVQQFVIATRRNGHCTVTTLCHRRVVRREPISLSQHVIAGGPYSTGKHRAAGVDCQLACPSTRTTVISTFFAVSPARIDVSPQINCYNRCSPASRSLTRETLPYRLRESFGSNDCLPEHKCITYFYLLKSELKFQQRITLKAVVT